jgi:ketopantoate reductase
MAENLNPEVVRVFVQNGHGNLEVIRELLEQEPGLLNASWDWGGGDWETALGAAAHMGRKDIALFLLEKGARIDIFSAAMLGKLGIVKAMITDNIQLRDARGPHTISLLEHAKTGGDDSIEIVKYLESLA